MILMSFCFKSYINKSSGKNGMQVSASSTHQMQEIFHICHKIRRYVRRYGKLRTVRIFWISRLLCRSSLC